MRISLVEAADPHWQFIRFSYPLQLGYLASYVKKKMPNVEIVVAQNIEEVVKSRPDIVGISSYSINYGMAVDFASFIKSKLDAPVILGGCHVSALPDTLDQVFDAAVVGEGEETFYRLIELFQREEKLSAESMSEIDGLLFYKKDEQGRPKIHQTRRRTPISPISKIPPPSREILTARTGTHYLSTSRGCPFNCLFCAPCILWDKPRFFPFKYVVNEIGLIIRQFAEKFTHLMFVDDLFIVNRKRLESLADFFQKSALNQVLEMQCNVRADLINDETAGLLAGMNFKTVNFGAESGSDRVLKYYNKRASVADNQNAIDILYNQGIRTIPSFIIGAPVETDEDFQATIDFIERNHHKMAGFEIFPLVPMPGSALWRYAFDKGLVTNDMEWSRLEPLLLDFDPDRYIYLVERVNPERFVEYVKIFQELYKKYNVEAMKFREQLKRLDENVPG